MLEFESSPESPYAQSPKHLISTATREATYFALVTTAHGSTLTTALTIAYPEYIASVDVKRPADRHEA
jgi:hypothetical protein